MPHTAVEVAVPGSGLLGLSAMDTQTSVDDIQIRIEHAVLESSKVAEVGRSDIVVNVARIRVVGNVVNCQDSSELVILHPRQKRDAKVF